ncbi:iron complex transport system ATP-binding protein [Actinoplanes octamycinicus]|uniref:Iron complex transport system ATP-binding protein n=1 Tax=Actinoplanes octamycinicus TaxID=135948 RepID=A0A7W7GUB2_9ACTN|nr:ABC transporter ATP-binding protein [Actinoplanes octamycinicus]MBB4738430.1 iron complex transport system ATP-binding protein [Actinoplanes octamycinicus]GIE57549.1 cobalamin/Fe3+-siderophore ABC transporter ATP-binding protein [Actinoplanes octamycinicus]
MTDAAPGGRSGAAILVTDLTVRLDGALIVDGVDLEVTGGEWVTVIGPNGAGKSTALRAVAGLLPFRGTVHLHGRPVDRLHRRDRAKTVAVVVQNPVVPPAMTVFDYVLLGRTPYIPPLGRESAADLAVVDEELAALDLRAFAGRRLDTLSGGERQRVFLARALAQGAEILLLDEPTSALDIGHQQEVLELVDRLRAERSLTVLATMHDLSTAGEYADRMVLLSAGRVAAAGTPTEVLTEANLAEHYRVKVRIIPGDHGPLVVAVRH